MTMTNIFVATVRVKRVACGRVGFEGCVVLPAIYAVHSSRLSLTPSVLQSFVASESTCFHQETFSCIFGHDVSPTSC